MVRIGVENHVGVGVEAVVVANLPHQRAVGVGLGEAEQHQQGDNRGDFRDHGAVVDLPVAPWPAEEVVGHLACVCAVQILGLFCFVVDVAVDVVDVGVNRVVQKR